MAKRSDSELIIFEGGLGSQLLALIRLLNLKHYGHKASTDTSYFYPKEDDFRTVQRPWRLDRYGYPISKIEAFHDSRVLPTLRSIAGKEKSNWEFARQILSSRFPLNETALENLLDSIGLSIKEEFSVVHLRRGDYLIDSSRVITDSEVTTFLKRFPNLLTKNLIFLSDSTLKIQHDKNLKSALAQHGISVFTIEGTNFDEITIHDLMRRAKFLLCSNSTFSFSAAVLADKDSVAVAPINFFADPEMYAVNANFRSAGNFFILD